MLNLSTTIQNFAVSVVSGSGIIVIPSFARVVYIDRKSFTESIVTNNEKFDPT